MLIVCLDHLILLKLSLKISPSQTAPRKRLTHLHWRARGTLAPGSQSMLHV